MSRVASNIPIARFNNGGGQLPKSIISRSSSNASSINGIGGGEKRAFNVRSAAPPPIQKETVHACPLCNGEYKDPRVLPCTHTYCFNCIRDKLIKNSRLTCPKCHYQAHPFDETNLRDLPPNLILSQEWRIGARPIPSIPQPKKHIAYQPTSSTSSSSQLIIPQTQILLEHDRHKSIINEIDGHDIIPTNGTNLNGIASIVNAFNRSSGTGENGNRLSRSSSVSSIQPIVSDLIKIYSEATAPKSQRTDHIITTTDKHDELIKIFEQARNNGYQEQRTSSPLNGKQSSQAYEEVTEEITWDHLVHGTIPVASSFPEQLQTAKENHHHPFEIQERPISIMSSNLDNLREMIESIHRQSPKKSPTPQYIPIIDTQLNHHLSPISHTHHNNNNDDEDINTNHTLNSMNSQRQRFRQTSNTDSVQSGTSDIISRRSPTTPIIYNIHPRINTTSTYQQQQDDKISQSSSRRSSDRFPPPPQNLETPQSSHNGTAKQRSTSSLSYRSSINDDLHEQLITPEIKIPQTERFNLNDNVLPTFYRNNSSQLVSNSSTSINRPPPMVHERETYYYRQEENNLSPLSTLSTPTNVTSRVETLLSDQKRLEHEIEEQIRRLKYDFDDVRKQIDRKQSSIHNEVKNIAAHLDDDITEHYHRKQKIYADLAADTNTVGTELERLKSNTNNNKQQLWDNLEEIELNIRNIRQAVEQHKEPHSALTFAEGRHTIGADTIGQITYNGIETQRNYTTTSSSSIPTVEQPITNLTPYKYIKMDHLSTLEPEAIAITENNKKILLGICNKLFVLNEYGDTLKTIPLTPSIRGIALSKIYQTHDIAYISHGETVSMIDIESGLTLDCVKETESSEESGTFLPLGIDTDNIRGCVYVCDYRNSSIIKFDDKLEFITQWRIYNHSDKYDEARPKLISVHGQRLYMIVEHSCKPYYNQGIAYTFSLHICDVNTGNIIKIIDADLLSTQRLRWPCSVHAINNEKCYILDTMTSGKYFNGQWQKHWSRVLEIRPNDPNVVTELFQLDSEAATMALTKQTMIIAANGEILFVDLAFVQQSHNGYEQNIHN
ncbi:unnamed protein product [Adineta steineri]|uniref:RING-type domain-containing protein n=1 Tax=Adineta steineri TaxID=433720 RepID=A0A819QW32_9BILA|nr:unnamed protein product [Adineta steineri]